MKKAFLVFISLFFLSSSLFAQIEEHLAFMKSKYREMPTETIMYADSILFYTSGWTLKEEAQIKFFVGMSYHKNMNHTKALTIYEEILGVFDKNEEQYIKILLQKANTHIHLKNHTVAAESTLEAIALAKANGYKKLLDAGNNSLSFLYFNNKEYDKALLILLELAETQKDGDDNIELSSTYNNVALAYKNIGDVENALLYNNKSLKLSYIEKDYTGIGKSYSNIGRLYERGGEWKKAINYFNKAISINKENNISNSIPYRNAGDAFCNILDYKSAEGSYLTALAIEKEKKNTSIIKILYNSLLVTAIQQKDFEKAVEYQMVADSLNSKILHKNNLERINMIENQHKLFQSQKEIAQIRDLNFKNKIILGILIFSLALAALYFYQRERTQHFRLSQEKMELEQKVLRSQMNPHFIFNALSSIQNSLLDNDPLKSASYLSKFAKLIRQNFDFINQNTIPLSDEIDALKNYIETQQIRFIDRFNYVINVDEGVDMEKTHIPPLLIQPFVENSIEHGFKNKSDIGLIEINIQNQDNKVCVEIKDNGNGILKTSEDGKVHALDIFKKRLILFNKKDEKSFKIRSSESGTTIKFCLTQ